MVFKFYLSMFLTLSAYNVHALETIKVIVVKDVYRDYKKFIGKRDPVNLKNFTGKGTRRDVVELVLIQQALNYNKHKYKIVFKEAPNYKRVIESIKQGSVAMGSNTVWKTDVDEKFSYVSVPTIKEGEFEAGFYVSPLNQKALQTKNLKDIRQLVGISSDAWTSDWEALTKLKLKKLYSTSNWESMVKMVHVGRGDFLLAPFQATSDMSLFAEGIRLVPIDKLKIKLSGSRVFTVSKASKNSKKIMKDLNDGLQFLLDQNIIQKAYVESGFINPKVTSWIFVN